MNQHKAFRHGDKNIKTIIFEDGELVNCPDGGTIITLYEGEENNEQIWLTVCDKDEKLISKWNSRYVVGVLFKEDINEEI